jgi:hypothetical protein
LRRFLTSSIRSFAALESSKRSLRTIISIGFCCDVRASALEEYPLLLPSMDALDDGRRFGVGGLEVLAEVEWTRFNRAVENTSADATTRRSEDV